MIRISQRPFRGAFFAPPGACSGRVPKPQIRKRASPEGWDAEIRSLRIHAGRGARSGPGAGTLRGPQPPQPCRRHGCAPAAPYTARLPFCRAPLPGRPFLRHAGALPAYLSRFTQIADKSIPVVCSAYPWCPVAFPGGGFTRGRGSAQRFSRR